MLEARLHVSLLLSRTLESINHEPFEMDNSRQSQVARVYLYRKRDRSYKKSIREWLSPPRLIVIIVIHERAGIALRVFISQQWCRPIDRNSVTELDVSNILLLYFFFIVVTI